MYAVKNEKGLLFNKDIFFFSFTLLAWAFVHFPLCIIVMCWYKRGWL